MNNICSNLFTKNMAYKNTISFQYIRLVFSLSSFLEIQSKYIQSSQLSTIERKDRNDPNFTFVNDLAKEIQCLQVLKTELSSQFFLPKCR